MDEGITEVLLTGEEISARVRELGAQISEDYAGKDLLLIGILKGSFIFLADLVRNITIPASMDFVAFSSYGSSKETCGVVMMSKDLDDCVDGKHVLVVDDIVDTGLTLHKTGIIASLYAQGAQSVRLCALLDKPSRRRADVHVDYVGFVIPDRFVVGYGLDFAGLYRNLPYVAVLKDD